MNPGKAILLSLFLCMQMAAGAAPGDSVRVLNEGRNGNNTADLPARVHKDVLQQSPDVVVMMIGTNDMFNPVNHLGMKAYKKNLQRLISLIQKHA